MNSSQHTDVLLLAKGLTRLPAQQPPSMGWPPYLRSLPALPAVSDLVARWPGLRRLYASEGGKGKAGGDGKKAEAEERNKKKAVKRTRTGTTASPHTAKVTKVESTPAPASISAFLEILRTIDDKKSVRRREYASYTHS